MEPSGHQNHEPAEQYAGPARAGEPDVEVRLRGHFEPIDGRFWTVLSGALKAGPS